MPFRQINFDDKREIRRLRRRNQLSERAQQSWTKALRLQIILVQTSSAGNVNVRQQKIQCLRRLRLGSLLVLASLGQRKIVLNPHPEGIIQRKLLHVGSCRSNLDASVIRI